MKPCCLPLVAALLAGLTLPVLAQTATPSPAAAASSPQGEKPARRLPTPDEKRNSATAPGDMRPERPVVQQIRIPLGKTPPKPTAAAAKPAPAASGGIDDMAARCEALSSPAARAQCRARHDQQHRSKP